MPTTTSRAAPTRLLAQATCPHCWQKFAPERVLWIAEAQELFGGDAKLGDAQQRFLPTRFTPDGNAIDPKGHVCKKLACPNCHLPVPRGLLMMEPLFLSIVGAPSSGKSYYLAAMTNRARSLLFQNFALSYNDADIVANTVVRQYESSLFQNAEPDKVIPLGDLIRKTELTGQTYDEVKFGNQRVRYPRPFLFSISPQEGHPHLEKAERLTTLLCLYDNAGEHFQPGRDTIDNPGTRHLTMSRAILFLFDPTQDPHFRAACRGVTKVYEPDGRPRVEQQSTLLQEVAERIRLHAGLGPDARYDRPLIMVLTKFDEWSSMLGPWDETDPWRVVPPGRVAGLEMERITQLSQRLRTLMLHYCAEMVSAAEGFSRDVTYIPSSSLGGRFELVPGLNGRLVVGIRPKDIRPQWVTVPLLYALSRSMQGLVAKLVKKPKGDERGGEGPR